jgi:hypothetical protein
VEIVSWFCPEIRKVWKCGKEGIKILHWCERSTSLPILLSEQRLLRVWVHLVELVSTFPNTTSYNVNAVSIPPLPDFLLIF